MANLKTGPGWYTDPDGAERWWDGSQWTEHVLLPDESLPQCAACGEVMPAGATQCPSCAAWAPGTQAWRAERSRMRNLVYIALAFVVLLVLVLSLVLLTS